MRSIYILIFAISFCVCTWDDPFPIYETSNEIIAQTTYVEDYNGKIHIAFIVKINEANVAMYTSVLPEGKVTKAIVLSNYSALPIAPSIKSANDGSHVYITMTLSRDDVQDVFFVESTTDGLYWSNPIIPRSNNIEDNVYSRNYPSIDHANDGTLYIFYWFDSRKLMMATRYKNSAIWEEEKDISIEVNCIPEGDPSMDTAIIYTGSNSYTILCQYVCKKDNLFNSLIQESTNNGTSWSCSYCRKYAFPSKFDSSFASTPNNLKIYQGLLQTEQEWKRAVVLEYNIGGYWTDMLSLPRISLEYQNINYCNIKDKLSIIYFAAAKKYRTEDHAMLLQFSADAPWKISNLTVPINDYLTTHYDVNCVGDNLLMTAVAEEKGLYGLKYLFIDTNSN